jgi:hypothetical protein
MNPEVKEKWLTALRDGQYLQGRERLTTLTADEQRHCCLGVLCQLYAVEGFDLRIRDLGDELLYDAADTYLPDSVENWAELDYDTQRHLGVLNDGGVDIHTGQPVQPHSFIELAQYIEENL